MPKMSCGNKIRRKSITRVLGAFAVPAAGPVILWSQTRKGEEEEDEKKGSVGLKTTKETQEER